MDSATLAELKLKIRKLPFLSTVGTRLLALNPQSDRYFEDVLVLAQENPAFALRIIRLSNSASNAPVEKIVSLRDAVVRIGTRNIASLISALALSQVFVPTTPPLQDLCCHSIQVAVTARVMACSTRAYIVNPEQAYLCGLLHDVGHLILLQSRPQDGDSIESNTPQSPKQYMAAEKDSYGFNHAILGMHICKRWKIPDLLSQVVRYHHSVDFPKEVEHDVKIVNLIHLTQLAEMFCVFLSLNPQALDLAEEELEQCLQSDVIDPYPEKAPFTAKDLTSLAGPIWNEAKSMIDGLEIVANK